VKYEIDRIHKKFIENCAYEKKMLEFFSFAVFLNLIQNYLHRRFIEYKNSF